MTTPQGCIFHTDLLELLEVFVFDPSIIPIVPSGRVLLWPISTQAIVFFCSGQVRLRPILACPFDHPKCQDEKKEKIKRKRKKKRKGGTINIVRVSVKASPVEGRRRLHTNTAYLRLSGSTGLHVGRPREVAPTHGPVVQERGHMTA